MMTDYDLQLCFHLTDEENKLTSEPFDARYLATSVGKSYAWAYQVLSRKVKQGLVRKVGRGTFALSLTPEQQTWAQHHIDCINRRFA